MSEQHTKQPDYCYCCEGDDECVRDLQTLVKRHELNVGDTYTEHDLVQNSASHYFNIDDMLEQMQERADEDAGEHAEGFPDLSAEEKSELNTLISDWLDKRVRVDFFTAENPRECTVTADDL